MLQVFLNRVAKHPILSTEYVFHRFLASEVSWVRIPLTLSFSTFNERTILASHSKVRDASLATPLSPTQEHTQSACTRPPRQLLRRSIRGAHQSIGNGHLETA